MIDPSTRADGPHHGPSPRRSFGRLRKVVGWMIVSLLVVGPWPVDDSGHEGSESHRRTVERLGVMPVDDRARPIRVGVAEVDLTPDSPRPLAGFIGQVRTPFVGVDSRCYARALTVEPSASPAITILTADLLLINDRLAKAVVDRAGLRPDQVYFTASHTHGGPGGWGDHPLEMLVAGSYDPTYFNKLADQLADVVRRSRLGLVPAEMGFVEVMARGRQSNRVEPGGSTHDALSALVFRPAGAPSEAPALAILTVFGAHATVSHPVPPRVGADYPSALVAELKRRTGAGMVLFASGAVGDASPARPKAASQQKSAETLGSSLASDLATALPSVRFSKSVEVASLRLDVDLPPVRLPFFVPWLRFSPVATWWISDRRTALHAVRLGPSVLVGFPGDYSGHLADRLVAETRESGLSTVATSFSGDFRGYLTSEAIHRRRSCYETRWMSFYGPSTGDYLTDLARLMVDRLVGRPSPSVRSVSGIGDVVYRGGLVTVLVVAGLVMRRRVRELASGLGLVSKGFLLIGLASMVGFVVDPDLMAWDRVGLPNWVRLLGIPIACLSMARSRRRGVRESAMMIGLACSLVSAGWVVALAVLRAWVTWVPASEARLVRRSSDVRYQPKRAIPLE